MPTFRQLKLLGLVVCVGFCASLVKSVESNNREAIIWYLGWYPAVGGLNGTREWKPKGYRYQSSREVDGLRNFPFDEGRSLPAEAPTVGSDEFYAAMREDARVTQQQMLAAHFDIVCFNMLPMPEYDPTQPLNEFNSPLAQFKTFLVWMQEAQRTGLKIAPGPDIWNSSADYPERRTMTADAWVRSLNGLLDGTLDAPALWRIDGRPVIIHFGTDSYEGGRRIPLMPQAPRSDGGWSYVLREVRNSGRKLFFFADIKAHPLTFIWNDIADGAYTFIPATPTELLSQRQQQLMRHLSVPFLWIVSPGYYRGGSAYTEPGFGRVHHGYLAAMQAGAQRVCVLTWNDFDEDSDIVPSANKGDVLLRLFSFYNRWFKDGKRPALERDLIFLSHPLRAPARVVTPSPVYGQLDERLEPTGINIASPVYSPKVFYWTYVASPTEITLDGVGTVTVPAGLSFGELGVTRAGKLQGHVGERPIDLGEVRAIGDETMRQAPNSYRGEGGLEYRYIDVSPSSKH